MTIFSAPRDAPAPVIVTDNLVNQYDRIEALRGVFLVPAGEGHAVETS